MAWKADYLDVILVPTGMGLLVLYHIYLYWKVTRRPLKTIVGINHINRRAWVYSIMQDNDKKNILAVQTLRNGIMAGSLMATTAILLSSAVAAFISGSNSLRNNLNEVIVGSKKNETTTIKFFCILLCFLAAFVCHIQSIRYMNHVNFLINIPLGPRNPHLTPDYVAKVLERGSDFYTMGTRGYYFAFPLLIWLFGPIPMFVSSLFMVPMLYKLDSSTDFLAVNFVEPELGSGGLSRRDGQPSTTAV